jgi:hypothetical protein
METDKPGAFPPPLVARINSLVEPAALRLEAALLFDDVRSLATNEERQRLAREIHDGDRAGVGDGRLRHRQRAGHLPEGAMRAARSCGVCAPR